MKRTAGTWVFIAVMTFSLLLPAVAAPADQATTRGRSRANRTPPTPPPLPPPSFPMEEAPEGYTLRQLEFFESYCFNEVNRQRTEQQLPPLIFLDVIHPAARNYSRQLAEENFFSHVDPAGRMIGDRLRRTGVSWLAMGENLSHATGFIDPVPEVVASWMRNPPHRGNILNPEFKYAAIGVWVKNQDFFFTQVFVNK